MNGETVENKKLKNYLLGLTEGDLPEQIEERLMTDDGYFQALLIEEEELIREYLDGKLSEPEQDQFEKHFLISDERRKKLNFARALQRKIDERSAENKSEEKLSKSPKIPLMVSIKSFF